jgi:Mu-like prophage FluMu N-terminal domain
MITITSKKDGFRRCGIAHPATAIEYPDKQFSKKELEILEKESMLTVVVTKSEAPKEPGGDKK